MQALIAIGQALAAVGSGLSVVFVVVIALVLVGLAGVYAVAAAIVLGRFGRAAERIAPLLVACAVFCAGLASLRLRLASPELALATWPEWSLALARELAVLGPACLAAMLLYRLALRCRLPARLALVVAAPALAGVALAYVTDALPVVAPGDLGAETSGLDAALEQAIAHAVAGLRAVAALAVLGLLPLAVAGLLDIRRRAEWFVALRYLVAERRQVFISVITLICIGAVAAGVWLIITVLSVMNGFERTWRDEIVGNYAHFLVRSYYGPIVDWRGIEQEIEAVDGVVAASAYLDADGMLRSAAGRLAPFRLRGIDPERAVRVTRLADQVTEGGLDALSAPAGDAPGLLIGGALAVKLGVGVGDELIGISPQGGAPTPFGSSPRLMRFRVVGLYASSFLQFDELHAFGSLAAAQGFLASADVVGGFEVKTRDFFRSRVVADAVAESLGHPFFARDWKELFPQFFHALNDNRSLMFLLLVMIMVVSAFVIVVTLMMMIMAKSADVAILKTMGARDESIELIFAIEGAIIGGLGVVAGVLAGIAVSTQLSWVQQQIEAVTGIDTLPASVYQISTLPSELDPVQVLGVVSIALVLALGATLLPSRHGARLDPVEALRDE